MTWVKWALGVLFSRPAIAIASAAIAVVLVGECNAFRSDQAEKSVPSVAPPTKVEERSPEVVLPCRDVVAIEPSEKDRKRLAEKYRNPEILRAPESGDNANVHSGATFVQNEPAILGERELPPMPSGGTALVALEPSGRVELTVAPNPEPLIDWRATWEAGAMYGIGSEGEARGRAWGAVEPLRFGRLHLRGEIGADVRAGVTDGYVMAGVVWRSR
jgi:hypothetical protein